jgi:hypothetical protein
MKKPAATLGVFLLASCSILLGALPAKAVTKSFPCRDKVDWSYHCASAYGYKGTDTYGYSNYSNRREDGTYPHNCTSFAAYMLSLFNLYDQNISYLGNGSQWDNNAYKVQGAQVKTSPQVGDIAVWDYFGGPEGHVAFVQELITNSLGKTIGVVIVDDQWGNRRTTIANYYIRDTTTGVLSTEWPDHFIAFPKAPSGGGKGYDMLSQPEQKY